MGLRSWLVLNELKDGRVRSKHAFPEASRRLRGGEKTVSNVLRFLWRRGLVERSLAGPNRSHVYWISEEGANALTWDDARHWEKVARRSLTPNDPAC